MTPVGPQRYRALDVEIDAASHAIHRDGETHHLRAQTMAVLVRLLDHRDRLVPKTELFEAIWQDVVVSDEALTQCIKEIRRALGDDHRNPRFIRTVPRAGYQFIAELRREPDDHELPVIDEGIVLEPTQSEGAGPKSFPPLRAMVAGSITLAAIVLVTGALYLRNPDAGSANSVAQTQDDAPPAVLTDNVEAYRAYRAGLDHALGLRGDAALADFQRAVTLDPEFAMAHGRIGFTYAYVLGLPEQAGPHLEEALRHEKRLTDFDRLSLQAWYAVAQQDFGNAISLYQEIVEQRPREVEGHTRLAKLLTGEERFDEALVALKRAIEVAPNSTQLLNEQCVLLSDLRRHVEAIAVCRRLVALAPTEANPYDSLGLALEPAGDINGALAAFTKAIELNPAFEVAVVHRGALLVRSGQYSRALEEFERYVKIAPEGHRYRGHESMAFVWLLRGQTDQALRYLRAGRQIGSDRPLSAVGMLVTSAAGIERARKIGGLPYQDGATRGHRISPRIEAIRQGRYALAVGRADEALRWFRQALTHRPVTWSLEWHDDCVAEALLQLGRPDEAIAEYERVLAETPQRGLPQYRLALAYEQRGDLAQARKQFERFLESWRDADADVPEVIATRRWLGERPSF